MSSLRKTRSKPEPVILDADGKPRVCWRCLVRWARYLHDDDAECTRCFNVVERQIKGDE
jgi:hypothetical protein